MSYFFFLPHLTSSVFYYWTSAWQHGIYFEYGSDPHSYEHYLWVVVKIKPEKKFTPVRDLNPWSLRYRCSGGIYLLAITTKAIFSVDTYSSPSILGRVLHFPPVHSRPPNEVCFLLWMYRASFSWAIVLTSYRQIIKHFTYERYLISISQQFRLENPQLLP